MKKIISSFLLLIIFGTTYAQKIAPHLNKNENDNIQIFSPKKIAIIGLTDNIEARTTFEKKMKESLAGYHIEAYQSTEISSMMFTEVEKAEEELNELIDIISQKGYDSFMITAVTGVEEKREDAEGYFGTYKIYHLETDIYIIEDKDLSLLWGMCLDIYDYQLVKLDIQDYVHAILLQMEYEGILSKSIDINQRPITTN